MRIGEVVYHPKYGQGTVKLILQKPGGLVLLRVDFGFAKLMVPVEELLKTAKGPPLEPEVDSSGGEKEKRTTPSSSSVSPLGEANLKARQGINALKLGQILEDQVQSLSVGTEAIEATFSEIVESAVNGETVFLLIEGAWGSGKTHALTLLQALAKNRQLATASAIMDGHSVSLSKAMELMQEVTNTLQFPSGGPQDGLTTWLREAVRLNKIRELEIKGAPLISKALSALPHGALDDPEVSLLIEDYFSLAVSTYQARNMLGRLGFPAPTLPILKAYRVAERSQAFREILTNWANFTKIIGAAGLLVIFDELDVEYAYTDWKTQYYARLRERRHHLLSELKNLQGAPLAIAFASVPGLRMATHFEDYDASEHIRQVFQDRLIQVTVPTPSQEQMEHLFERILELYRLAYEYSPRAISESERSLLFNRLWAHYSRDPNPVPRKFVRLSLEVFDLLSLGTKQRFNEILKAIQ